MAVIAARRVARLEVPTQTPEDPWWDEGPHIEKDGRSYSVHAMGCLQSNLGHAMREHPDWYLVAAVVRGREVEVCGLEDDDALTLGEVQAAGDSLDPDDRRLAVELTSREKRRRGAWRGRSAVAPPFLRGAVADTICEDFDLWGFPVVTHAPVMQGHGMDPSNSAALYDRVAIAVAAAKELRGDSARLLFELAANKSAMRETKRSMREAIDGRGRGSKDVLAQTSSAPPYVPIERGVAFFC